MYTVQFELFGLPKSINSLHGHHWGVKQKEKTKWHELVGRALTIVGIPNAGPLKKAKLNLIRHSSGYPDPDNLVSSFKFVIDALIIHKVIIDDRYDIIGMPEYGWQKAKPKQGKIVVRVDEDIDLGFDTANIYCLLLFHCGILAWGLRRWSLLWRLWCQ